ncbi:MAG: Holliday junction resolvase RuvX [Armatimonadota bacterium]|nr:Holliday junction resolvase RuvX [Armatimonadota bacterium]MDW8157118.1 Holliday junction resolvase RuvX [Armatimonadota bacterium]
MRGRVLAVDYGSRRIGLAISDPTGTATEPLPNVQRRGDDQAAREVAELARRHGAQTIVVGLPLRLDGTEGPEAQAVRRFAGRVEQYCAVPVRLWDERLTSVQAERLLTAGGVRRERRRVLRDRLSAALLLRSFLEAHPDP